MVWSEEAQVQNDETDVLKGTVCGFQKEELSLPEKILAAVSRLDDAGCENYERKISVQS